MPPLYVCASPTGSGGSGLLSGLLSPTSTGSGRGGAGAGAAPGRHRLATEGTAGTPGSGNNSARGLSSEALSRLFSSPTSEADLFSALQVSMRSQGGGLLGQSTDPKPARGVHCCRVQPV